MKIIAIDPGNVDTGYVVAEHDGTEIRSIVDKGKVPNAEIFPLFERYPDADVAIEMVASYGMAVGADVFETCVWIGRFEQAAQGHRIEKIYRRDEKLYICGILSAKDSNIAQAIVDRFAHGQPNRGKGTKKAPGFFYGFSADMWQAMAVATTYLDKFIRGIQV